MHCRIAPRRTRYYRLLIYDAIGNARIDGMVPFNRQEKNVPGSFISHSKQNKFKLSCPINCPCLLQNIRLSMVWQ